MTSYIEELMKVVGSTIANTDAKVVKDTALTDVSSNNRVALPKDQAFKKENRGHSFPFRR